MSPSTLLIDLDNTLVHVRARRAWATFFRVAVPALIRRFGLMRGLRTLRILMKSAKEGLPGMTIHEATRHRLSSLTGISSAEAEELIEKIFAQASARLSTHFIPALEANEFLRWARGRYRMILATNPVWPREFAELRLRWAGIDAGVFDDISNSSNMHFAKPDPAYYRELLEKYGLRQSECLMIGDSKKNDLPASILGIPVFLLDGPCRGFPQLTRLLEGGRSC